MKKLTLHTHDCLRAGFRECSSSPLLLSPYSYKAFPTSKRKAACYKIVEGHASVLICCIIELISVL